VWGEGPWFFCLKYTVCNSLSGAQHSRHRKIMNPAFSYGSLRVFLPLFRHTAHKVCRSCISIIPFSIETTQIQTAIKWKFLVAQSGSTSSVIDIPSWLARTTLNAIGEGIPCSASYSGYTAGHFRRRVVGDYCGHIEGVPRCTHLIHCSRIRLQFWSNRRRERQ
jgi:hypothetical protein